MAVISGVIAWGLGGVAGAQVSESATLNSADATAADASSGLAFFNNPSFLIIPVPISSPAIGTGASLGMGVLFKTDETSSSSLIGGAGFYTNNGSWGAGILNSIALLDDRYRLKAGAAYARILSSISTASAPAARDRASTAG